MIIVPTIFINMANNTSTRIRHDGCAKHHGNLAAYILTHGLRGNNMTSRIIHMCHLFEVRQKSMMKCEEYGIITVIPSDYSDILFHFKAEIIETKFITPYMLQF